MGFFKKKNIDTEYMEDELFAEDELYPEDEQEAQAPEESGEQAEDSVQEAEADSAVQSEEQPEDEQQVSEVYGGQMESGQQETADGSESENELKDAVQENLEQEEAAQISEENRVKLSEDMQQTISGFKQAWMNRKSAGKEKNVQQEEDLHEEINLVDEPEDSLEPEEDIDEKREARRQRRVRNEMLVYMTTFLVLILVAGGVFTGVRAIKQFMQNNTSAEGSEASEGTDNIQNLVNDMLAGESELPTEAVDVVTPEEQLEDYIDTVIAGMTLEEKVAGLIITTPEQLTGVDTATMAGNGTQTAIEAMPLGGLVYYAKNMQSTDQLKEMLANTIAYSKYPIFLAVNEGGDDASSVQNSSIEVTAVKEPGEISSAAEAYTLGSTIGTYLADLNFNVNFAPTADILHVDNAAVAGYCFSGDAAANAEYVSEFVRGLEEQGISAALKTFPGTGHLTNSTEDGTVNTDKSRADYADDFTVFKAGIDAGADFVMVSNIVASELSGGVAPCSMSSSVVTDILRGEMGYTGIIITEPMNVTAITEYYSSAEAAIAALKAGCDMILLPENLQEAYQGILDGVKNGTVAEARINDSLKRVFRVKYADKLNDFAE